MQALIAVDRRAGYGTQRTGVVHDAADEMVGQFRAAQPALIFIVDEEIFTGLDSGEMKMRMQAAASAVGKRLGHMRGDSTVFLGDLRSRHLKENDAIGGHQRIGVVEVDLVLAVAILVVALVDPVVKRVERQGQILQIGHGRRHRAVVVAGLG